MKSTLLLAPFCLVLLGSPLLGMSSNDVSWGKPGVPLDQYARDATECADTSRRVSAVIKPDTLRQLDGLSSMALLDIVGQLANDPDSNPMAYVSGVTSTKSPEDIARRSNTFGAKYVSGVRGDVQAELQEVLNKCLRERGYVQIRLTDDQRRTLSRLKRHSAERTAYLHSIDADPGLIERQRLIPAS